MEPFDMDEIIRRKLQESSNLHQQQINAARPVVWEGIQSNISGRPVLRWYHLAAAVVLLMLCFSFILYRVQQAHRQEIQQLAGKFDQMHKDYQSQITQLQTKNAEVATLGNQLQRVEQQLGNLQQQTPRPVTETVVYRTDTVFVTQVKYITAPTDPEDGKGINTKADEEPAKQIVATEASQIKTDDAIFTSSSNRRNAPASETLKLKFGSFAQKD